MKVNTNILLLQTQIADGAYDTPVPLPLSPLLKLIYRFMSHHQLFSSLAGPGNNLTPGLTPNSSEQMDRTHWDEWAVQQDREGQKQNQRGQDIWNGKKPIEGSQPNDGKMSTSRLEGELMEEEELTRHGGAQEPLQVVDGFQKQKLKGDRIFDGKLLELLQDRCDLATGGSSSDAGSRILNDLDLSVKERSQSHSGRK